MRWSAWLTATVAVLLIANLATGQVPGPQVEATADANYEGVGPGLDNDLAPGVANGPPISAEAASFQPGELGGDIAPDFMPGIAYDDANAQARAFLPGALGAVAYVPGFSNPAGTSGVQDASEAIATARVITNWQVNGPGGGQTPIDVAAFYDGFLYVSTNSSIPPPSAGEVIADVEVALNVITTAGTTNVFSAGGTLKLNALGNPNNQNLATQFSTIAGDPATEWENSWAARNITLNGFDFLYELDYFETFDDLFTVQNNTTWAFESIITVTAENQVGPFEIFATSDFFNTASAELSTDTPGAMLSGLNPVPEPGSAGLLGALLAPGLALRGRRRQHRTVG
jgi:hypothetical protein